jgi:hypothetical protein
MRAGPGGGRGPSSGAPPCRSPAGWRARIGVLAAALVLAHGCEREAARRVQFAAGPRVRAGVLTVRATLRPQNSTYWYWIVIAGERVRLGNEADRWRLFDFRNQTITFVDDLARTYRTVPMAAILADYRSIAEAALPAGVPRAEFATTNQQRVIAGVTATLSTIRMGGYERELWMADTAIIPPRLFAMMVASQPSESSLRGAMQDVNAALLQLRGFPLADRARLTWGGTARMSTDREVVKIEWKDVPKGWLNVDARYRRVAAPAAPTVPGAGRPRGASPPGDRKVPEGGSRPSSTDRKAP